MTLTKTAIPWAERTCNVTPFCSRGCPYCYRGRILPSLRCPDCRANQPHCHPNRLAELTRPARDGRRLTIFLNSMGETFDPLAERDWYPEIWRAVERSPHQIIVLTKRPDLINPHTFAWAEAAGRDWPANLWLGISATDQDELDRRMTDLLKRVVSGRLILSLEPALEPYPDLTRWLPYVAWVIFGGLSGPWLPPGWTLRGSLRKAQAAWAAEVGEQVAAYNKDNPFPIGLFVKREPVWLPLPAPRVEDFPAEMLIPPPAVEAPEQAALF